jgi:aspartyl-tRNA(Asn)/glutamyl-tRNA(Gln) amidotransferase subunit C
MKLTEPARAKPINDPGTKLTEDDVRHVAELANLELRDDEIVKMTHDLRGILTHIDKLNEVDTSDVQPMAQVIVESDAASVEDPSPTLRDDVEHPTLGTAAAIANAPLASKEGPGSGYFKVPKVIER